MDFTMQVKNTLRGLVSISKHKAAMFFKTGKGEYAEGDEFIGITVPDLRKAAKEFMFLSLRDLHILLESKINEERFFALTVLTQQYKKSNDQAKEEIFQFYMQNLKYINNWNLVDTSAYWIVGAHLWNRDRSILKKMATSKIIWERRISIVSTLSFIRKNDLTWTFKIAEILLLDTHDLIHKSVGWMLREAGKKDKEKLIVFLDKHIKIMPRTMLRYAIEKFPEEQRKNYLYKSKLSHI